MSSENLAIFDSYFMFCNSKFMALFFHYSAATRVVVGSYMLILKVSFEPKVAASVLLGWMVRIDGLVS